MPPDLTSWPALALTLAAVQLDCALAFNPDQERDEKGRFGSGGGDGKSETPAPAPDRFAPNPKIADGARPELDAAEKQSVKAYTGGGYQTLNEALRAGRPLDPDQQKMHDGIQSAMARSKELAEPVQVTRGLTLYGAEKDQFIASMKDAAASGEPVIHKGFASTTTLPSGYFGGNVHLNIAATRGLDVKPHSLTPVEQEMLLPNQMPLRIKEVTQKGDQWHIKAEQLQQEIKPPAPKKEPEKPPAPKKEPEKPPDKKPWWKVFSAVQPPEGDPRKFVDADASAYQFPGSEAKSVGLTSWPALASALAAEQLDCVLAVLAFNEDQPRDEHGRFGEGGGGGTDPAAQAKQDQESREDQAAEDRRADEDAQLEERQQAEAEAVEEKRTAEDEKIDTAREKEDEKIDSAESKENAALEKEKEKADREDAKYDRNEEKEQGAIDRSRARLDREEERVMGEREKESAAIDRQREKEDGDTTDRRDAESTAIEEAHEREEITDQQRADQHAANDAKWEAEDRVTQEARDREDSDRQDRLGKEDDAFDKRLTEVEGQQDALDDRRGEEDVRREERDGAFADRENDIAERYSAKRETLEEERGKEDDARQDRRDREDAARADRHEAERTRLQERRDQEDRQRGERRQKG